MKKSFDVLLFNIFSYITVAVFSLFCVIPFLMLISGSISNEALILKKGYNILPRGFSTLAYKTIFEYPGQILNGYMVTIFISLSGCFLSLLLISMTAYVLFRKDFKYRNTFAFIFYFTTLFNGGMVPTYILVVRYLHLKNNILALILPAMFNVFYLLIMRNFMNSAVPDSLVEAAKIDGANDYFIFFRVVLPIMKPALATIGLFQVISYWNDWWHAMLYIDIQGLYPLQYVLYRMLISARSVVDEMTSTNITLGVKPTESIKLAMTVVAIGPIIFAYPFIQRYFVKGIIIGAVKG